MKIIEIENLVKIYNHKAVPVKALDGVNLSFTEGEFTAIVGPSGSGKTTLLNLLGGLDYPDEGRIIIGDTELTALSDKKLTEFRLHHIGFVFQSYNLIPVLTARENIEFVMELQGIPARERRLRSMELLEAVGLADRANARPSQLSGGQQQRVAVARALASKPRYILADEPTANLDSRTAENLLQLMLDMNRQYQATFLFSTHDFRVVEKARRIIYLQDGRVEREERRDV